MKINNNLINGFLKRAGSHVFIATFTARATSFLSHLIALKLLNKDSLGELIYVYSFIAFLIPFSGLGLGQSLARFGALLKTKKEKDALFLFVLKQGIFTSLLLMLIIGLSSFIIPFKFENSTTYYLLFTGVLFTYFLRNIIQIQLKLLYKNKTYAYSELVFSFFSLFIITILTYYFKEYGYISAIVFGHLIVFIVFYKKIELKKDDIIPIKRKKISFWRYGFFASLAYVTTLLLFEIDNILIGNLLNNAKQVTFYKYISLIPFSLLYLPRVLNTTDFVYITENIFNKTFINDYIKNYFKIFSIVSICIILGGFLFSDYILLIFGKEYVKYNQTFTILLVGISGILLFRGLFGNLLSSIGKAHYNFYIAVFAIVINIISNYYFIPKYGIKGAAITSSIIMWTTGITSYILFLISHKIESNKQLNKN